MTVNDIRKFYPRANFHFFKQNGLECKTTVHMHDKIVGFKADVDEDGYGFVAIYMESCYGF